ncbi:hypothetical protein ACPOL_2646 [Acidisarcina polymorpha]|uniref:Uncharacterized protein n=1 Tax=Acidisarcina polymorpha TaxID=2211140 RepID=A0A2Z5FYK5_9BACT|nr:hypothetical protein ACPOL_2646 [Acidisarcina polymorpha]
MSSIAARGQFFQRGPRAVKTYHSIPVCKKAIHDLAADASARTRDYDNSSVFHRYASPKESLAPSVG